MDERYPRPPWQTHGNGLVLPCLVRVADVRVPAPFKVVQTAGYTLGALVYLQYVHPSPMPSHELMWISALVRCGDPGYEVPAGWGPLYYVGRNYVDDARALEAGRTEWSLPRDSARFWREQNRIRMRAEDGTELSLSFRPRGFAFPAPTRISTVQTKGSRVVRFRARGRAQVQLATCEVERFEAGDAEWSSFQSATLLPGLASHLKSFSTVQDAPEVVARAMESLRPAAMPF